MAARSGYEGIMKCLISNGADVNAATKKGITPLHCAAESGLECAVRCLVLYGAEINAVDSNGKTPLQWAVSINGNKRLYRYDGYRYDEATLREHKAMIDFLMNNGAVDNGAI
jgi:ankyrin repeat protein